MIEECVYDACTFPVQSEIFLQIIFVGFLFGRLFNWAEGYRMIEIILPFWLPEILWIMSIGAVIIAFVWYDLTKGCGIGIVFVLMFFVLLLLSWFVLSLFGLIPASGSLIPPGPQLFNISTGAP
jgi:hypothetical protein